MKFRVRICTWTAVAAVLLVVACDRQGPLEWNEEVRLDDTRTIWVHRKAEYKAPREIGQGPAESWYSMDLAHPVTGEKVHVEAALRASGADIEKAAREKALLMQWPITFQVAGRDLYLVTMTHAVFNQALHCPNPPYQLYRWQSGRWEWRPLTEIPHRQFRASFVDSSVPRELKKAISGANGELSERAVQRGRPLAEDSFDLTGMKAVTYEASHTCHRYTHWLAGKKQQN